MKDFKGIEKEYWKQVKKHWKGTECESEYEWYKKEGVRIAYIYVNAHRVCVGIDGRGGSAVIFANIHTGEFRIYMWYFSIYDFRINMLSNTFWIVQYQDGKRWWSEAKYDENGNVEFLENGRGWNRIESEGYFDGDSSWTGWGNTSHISVNNENGKEILEYQTNYEFVHQIRGMVARGHDCGILGEAIKSWKMDVIRGDNGYTKNVHPIFL